eukprot:jgi/Psemu1/285459/fgenesh1_pg.89_\
MPPNRRLLAELESHNKVSTISEKAALYAPATGKRDRRKPTRFVAQPQNDEQVGRAVTRYSLVSLSGGRRKRKKGGNDDGQTPHQNRLVDEVESQKQLSRVRELAELRNRSRFKGKDRQTLWNVAKHARGEIAAHEIEETVRIGSISNMEETPLPLGEAISSSISDNNIGTNEIKEGYKIRKAFTFWYEGQVISEKPEWRYCNVENQDFEMWKVRYIDNDEEELTREHLEECHANYVASRKPQLEQKAGTSTTATSPICTSHPEDIDCYNEAFLDLCNRVGFTHQEVRIVLSEMKRPYCLNTAVQRIIKRKDDTGRARHMQRRELRMLELFAGDAVVSEAFHRYSSFWRTRSIDNNPTSRATDRVDFMKLTWNNIGTVPDFVWISLPYFTCGKQRSPKDDQFAKTPEALEQDRYLARVAWFLEWAKKKKGHMIAVIENPVEWLSDKPIMKTIVDKMNFHPHDCQLLCVWSK